MLIKQSSATKALMVLMVDSADNTSPKTGLTPTVTLSKNGAAFGAPAGAVSEVANGWYKVAANAADSNTLGQLVLHATAAAAVAADSLYEIVAFDPDDAAGLGLSRLDAAISSRSTYAGGAVASVTAGVTLASAEHTAISGTDVPAALTAQGYTPTRAGYLDVLNGLVSAIWGAATRTLSAFGFTPNVGNVTGTIPNATVGGYAVGQDPATLVLDVAQSGHNAAGSVGNKIGSAASAGDPWTAALPGSYGSGSAGKIVGDNLNETVASRLATAGYTAPPVDYQQRGVAVTLPAVPSGYGGATAAAVRAEIDANSTILAAILGSITDADVVMASGGLTATMSVYGSGASHSSPLFTVALSRASTSDPFSLNRN